MRYVCSNILFTAILMLSGCGISNQSGQASINEGLVQNANEPSIVLVKLPNGKGICSGNIVGLKTVLTAAHCVVGLSGRFEIVSDKGRYSTYTYYLNDDGDVGSVDDKQDIAVLVFDEIITDPRNILAIGSTVDSGERFKMVGYGCQYLDTRSGSGTRRALTTSLYSDNEDGFLTVRQVYSLSVRGVTAGGTCFGDSGGAGIVFRNGKQVLVGNVHAGGPVTSGGVKYEASYFSDLTRSDNRAWLEKVNDAHDLGMLLL